MNNQPYKFALAFAAITLMTASSIHAAKEPMRLKPTSKWAMEYKEDSCRLLRKFGENEQSVIVMLDKYQPGESFKISLVGKPVKITDETRDLKIKFGPNEAEQELSIYAGDYGKDMPALFVLQTTRIAPLTKAEVKMLKENDSDKRVEIAPIQMERLAAVRELSIRSPLLKPVTLETGPLERAFDAMEKCTDDLLTGWGIDAAKHKNLKQRVIPKSNPGTWVKSGDYPMSMVIKGARSIVNFRLSVDPAGKPTACSIQAAMREALFDEVVCRALMKRASFEPALAADGTPVASYYTSTVRFALP